MDIKRSSSTLASVAIYAFVLAGISVQLAEAQQTADAPKRRWAIAIHGGAGRLAPDLDRAQLDSLERSLRRTLAEGQNILSSGGSAMDAVEKVVVALEDDPRFNAGKGAAFTSAGAHELDASIMDGAMLRCGAVAAIKFQKNPIKAARLVMQRSPHVLLVGEGADEFAAANGHESIAQEYFYTPRRFRELQIALEKMGRPLEKPAYPLRGKSQSDDVPVDKGTGGTVGCVALDTDGNLAAATSTGGLTGKLPGRVGDTAICGAGTYANNKNCAVSGTGKGEEYIRHMIAARVAMLMDERGLSVDKAVAYCLHEVLRPGDGGLIAVDRQGRISMRANTAAMPRAMADSTGLLETAVWIKE